MANSLTDVGYVTPAGQDVFPTTGPHLDVRVLKDGKYVDPGTIRSLLTRLKVGKEKKPLWQQKGEEWNPSYTITSPFGTRVAPTKGASTQHMGQDYGIAGGTPLAWEGPGTFTPGKGYGTIKTTDAQGTPYEIRLLHTKGGKPTEATPTTQPQVAPADTYILVGGTKKHTTPESFLSAYLQQSLGAETPEVQSMINPIGMLTQAFSQTPNYLT
jgi:hypothetical protein